MHSLLPDDIDELKRLLAEQEALNRALLEKLNERERENYLFFGSDHGGERGALLYSLLGTCKLNGVEPESYLRYVLDVIADWPINRVSELLPWRITLPTE
ncbi:transposase domain-containing protein [Enterobacter cloacae]